MGNDKETKVQKSVSEILPHEVIRHIPIANICVDGTWNARNAADTVTDTTDGVQDTTGKHTAEGAGLAALILSLRDDGQDTPVIVRAVPENRESFGGKKIPGNFTHELACGFRRFAAVQTLNTEPHLAVSRKDHKTTVANTADGTILAVVRDIPNGLEARILNARENTNRNNLKTPDVMLVVREMSHGNMNQVDIAKRLGITQGYVAKLLAIGTLPKPLLDHWREGIKVPGMPENVAVKQLTTAELVDLANVAKSEKEGEIVARYIRMLTPVQDAPGGSAPSDDKVGKRIVETAKLLATLVTSGVFEAGTMEWSKIIGPKKMGYPLDSGSAEQVKIIALCDAADAAFEAQVKAIDEQKAKANRPAESVATA
jgi:ParB-like chromosome segregation protein Spo0J